MDLPEQPDLPVLRDQLVLKALPVIRAYLARKG